MAIPSVMRHTTRPIRNQSMTRTIITNYLPCLAVRRTITSRWVLVPIPQARSTLTSNGLKGRMDSMGTNGLLPLSLLRRAMSVQECTPQIIQTSIRGLLNHHHTTLILPTRVTRDQSHHTTTTRKRAGKGTEVMVVRRAMYLLQGLASEEARLETNMELVEGVPENHPLAFRNVLVVRLLKVPSGGKDQAAKRICATRKLPRTSSL